MVNKMSLALCFHNGMLQVLPTLWEFPKINVKQLIENWDAGNQREMVPPFSLLEAKYVHYIVQRKTKLRHMMYVLQVIERIERIDFIYKDREGWDLEYTK